MLSVGLYYNCSVFLACSMEKIIQLMLLSPALCDQMRPKVITLIGAYNIFKKSFKFKFELPFATQ